MEARRIREKAVRLVAKGSKTTKIIRTAGRQAQRDVAQVGKTAAAASKAIKAASKLFIKPSPAKELSKINKLLGEEHTSLRSARAALKEQTAPARPRPGWTLPAGVVIKRPAAAPGKPVAAPPAPEPVFPMQKPPGRPGSTFFRTRQLPGGITQDDVERGLVELAQENLAQKMDALLQPGEQWAFMIQNPQTGFFFRSKMLYGSWSAMVRDLRKNYGDLGPNAMQALTFIRVKAEMVPQRKLTEEEYEALVRQHKTSTQEAREKYQQWRKEELSKYRQELAKRGLPIPKTMAETIKSFGQVFEREERLKAAGKAERAAEARARKNERARERRAFEKAQKQAAVARKQAGYEKQRATKAARREATVKAQMAAERKRAAKRETAFAKREAALLRENKRLREQLKNRNKRGKK